MRPQSRQLIALLVAPLGLYFAVAGVLSHVPVNATWREPAAGVTIYLASNGFHTGIVVPQTAAGIDWRATGLASDLREPSQAGAWLMFGWGDRDFYANTPTWRDVRPRTVLSALIGSGKTVVHVDHLDDFYADANTRPLRLTPDQYRRLAAYIRQSLATPRRASPGYGARDVFYTARGRYSALQTCNIWTGNALAAAGIRTAMWSPFAGGIMQWANIPPLETLSRRDGR